MSNFDLVIAVPDNRKNAYILNIVKELGDRFNIGILIDYGQFDVHKRAETNYQFLSRLVEFGAEEVTEESNCVVFLVPILRYSEEFLHKVSSDGFIKHKKIFTYVRFMFGVQHLVDLNKLFGFSVLFSEDQILMQTLLAADGSGFSTTSKIRSVDFVYTTYPAFADDFELDYLIIFPTKLSFKRSIYHVEPDVFAKYNFIRNINKLLKQIPSCDMIAYKRHSVVDGGAPFIEKKLESALSLLPVIAIKLIKNALEIIFRLNPSGNRASRLEEKAIKVLTGCEYLLMQNRCRGFSEFTEYHNLSVELFYPNIRKGIISGRSNAVWGALKAGLAVYNCDDNVPGSGVGDFTAHSLHYSILQIVFRRFGVKPCRGELRFDQSNFKKVSQPNSINLVDYLTTEMTR